jgi:hypothetical protein
MKKPIKILIFLIEKCVEFRRLPPENLVLMPILAELEFSPLIPPIFWGYSD